MKQLNELRIISSVVFFTVWLIPASGLSLGSVSDEFEIGTPNYIGAINAQYAPSIAFNGDFYFVVWGDGRSSPGAGIYATRISTNGMILDMDAIQIVPPSWTGVSAPKVINCGKDFLVTWFDPNTGYSYGRWVGSDGRAALTNVFVLSGFVSVAPPSPANTNLLLTWSASGDIYGNVMTRDGVMLHGSGFSICVATNSQTGPVASPVGTNWLVVWTDARNETASTFGVGDIFGALVTKEGVVLNTNGFSICSTNYQQASPALASVSNVCLVTWRDSRQSFTSSKIHVYGNRVNETGQVLDGRGFVIDNSQDSIYLGKVAASGQNWFVSLNQAVNTSSCRTLGKIISPQGTILHSPLLENTPKQFSNPVVAFGGTNFFVAWESYRGVSSALGDIVGTRVSTTGVVFDGLAPSISLSASSQNDPAIATDGTNYFCVWSDNRKGDLQWNIYGARIRRDGLVMDPGGIPITTLSAAQTNPAVAFNGTHYFVTWSDTRDTSGLNAAVDIYGARVDLNGLVLDTNGFPIETEFSFNTTADVASDGTNFMVVWAGNLDTYNSKVSCTRVSASGQVLDSSGIALFSGAGGAYQPKIARVGQRYFVAWWANYAGTTELNSQGLIVTNNYPTSFGGTSLAGGSNALACVWSGSYGVNGAVYRNPGAPIQIFGLSGINYDSSGYAMAIAGNGKDFLVVHSPPLAGTPWSAVSGGVCVVQVTDTARVIQTNAQPSFTNIFPFIDLSLSGNRNDYLLAYTRKTPMLVPRLFARTLNNSPRLVDLQKNTNQFGFTLDGVAERRYEIYSSTNLNYWESVNLISNQNGRVQISTFLSSSNRFYRARQID